MLFSRYCLAWRSCLKASGFLTVDQRTSTAVSFWGSLTLHTLYTIQLPQCNAGLPWRSPRQHFKPRVSGGNHSQHALWLNDAGPMLVQYHLTQLSEEIPSPLLIDSLTQICWGCMFCHTLNWIRRKTWNSCQGRHVLRHHSCLSAKIHCML